MRVLLTPPTSRLFAPTARSLRAAGHRVRGYAPSADALGEHADEVAVGSPHSPDEWAWATDGCDAVVHLGGIETPEDLTALVALATSIDAGGPGRLVLASDLRVLGHLDRPVESPPFEPVRLPVDEAHPVGPHDGVSALVLAAEDVVRGAARRGGPQAVAVRAPSIWYSPEEPIRGDDPLHGHIYVDDLADALARAVDARMSDPFTVIMVAGADSTADDETSVVVATQWPEVAVVGTLPGWRSLLDTRKSRSLLDWKPQRTWHE